MMTSWGATKAKAQFSEMLDQAVEQGPQLVTRRKQQFFIGTRAQWEMQGTTVASAPPQTIKRSLWERLRCAPEAGDPELILPVRRGGVRKIQL